MKSSLLARCLLPGILTLLLGLAPATVRAEEPTAFALAKEGNRYLGEDSKNRVVQIRSEKSIGTLVPNIWFVVYYDPDATSRAVEIKFMAGQKVSVKRPARLLESAASAQKELPAAKLKIDSDKALDIAKSEPLLKNLRLKASQMKLERRSSSDETPVWKVEFWAAKLDNPNRNVSIGEVFINAEDGKVVKNDLKIGKVD